MCLLLSAPAALTWANYTQNSDGTTTDNMTGLVWDRHAFGSCAAAATGSGPTFVWQDALKAPVIANACNYEGHYDWRLPNLRELESLVLISESQPAVDGEAGFDDATISNVYWSSTPYVDNFAGAIGFGDGSISSGTTNIPHSIRLVRCGQPLDKFDPLAAVIFRNGFQTDSSACP